MENLDNIIVTDILRPMTVHAKKGKIFRKTNRESFGLSLCISGQITYTIAGKQTLSVPGTAVILPKGSSYTLHAEKAGLFPLINFQCDSLELSGIPAINLSQPQACIADYEAISRLYHTGGSRLEICSVFYSLLHKLLPGRTEDSRLSAALEYIGQNLSDPTLSNNHLAAQAGISEVYLRKLFLELYNTTPKQYILQIRIRKAKQLLSDTPLSVTAVSEACGFSSVYHFCRAFKKKTGVTPTQYAKRNRVSRL